jgi:hypothetical protein
VNEIGLRKRIESDWKLKSVSGLELPLRKRKPGWRQRNSNAPE